jgi:hypothetical protein
LPTCLRRAPDVDDASSTLARGIADDRSAHVLGVSLDGLGVAAFFIFLTALWGLLHRAEPEPGPSLLVLLGGGALGIAFFLGLLAQFLWVVAAT